MATIRTLVSLSSKHLAGVKKLQFAAFNLQYAASQSTLAGTSTESTSSVVQGDVKKVSKAMKSYMERAKIHDNFIKQQLHEYNIGKRHLANMMGKDPEFFTQDDIDEAIRYLFPSGLFDPRARPMLKHPDEVYPKKKAAEFDITGRPYHSFFYTAKPNYYQLLHDIATKLGQLDRHEDRALARGALLKKSNDSIFAGSEWLPIEKMESILLEKLNENQYAVLIKTLDRISQHPYSSLEKEFILKYRRQLAAQTEIQKLPELSYDEAKRPYVEFSARRKRANATVKVTGQGSGIIKINESDIHYFSAKQDKEQVIYPLQFSAMLGKVDVEATVTGGGPSGQAGAIRHGLSMCLRSFVDAQMMERMRIAGLLSFDPRKRERKKPGQPGARKKPTWKKR